jgi:PAS domain S-box-containing protein
MKHIPKKKEQDVGSYKDYVKQRVDTLVPILARSAVGDYSMDVPMDVSHDDFSELYAGVQFMIEAIRDQLAEIDQRNDELRAKIDELEHLRADDETLLNSIGEAVVAVDDKGKVRYANQEMIDFVGIEYAEMVGKELGSYILEDQYGEKVKPSRRPISIALKRGVRVSISNEYYYTVGDERIPVWVTANPIKVNDKVVGAISVWRNIAREKELDRMKSDLIFLASHQLKTPASAVKSSLSLLIDGYLGDMPTKQMNDLRTAYAENNFELKLIDDILNVASLESKRVLVEPERFDFSVVIRDIVSEEKAAAADRKQKLKLTAPAKLAVTGDPTKLREVFENLITNAIKYTPEGGRIGISVKSSGADFVVTVVDDGIGIPEKEISSIFARFFRASNATQINMPGTGLGLYLAKSIVEMHGGGIEVESEMGKGTTFTVTLPKKYKEMKHNG